MFDISTSSKTLKTFVFEKEETHQSDLVEHEVNPNALHTDLSKLFATHSPPEEHNIFIYDPI